MATIHRYQCTIMNNCASRLKIISKVTAIFESVWRNSNKELRKKFNELYSHEHKDGYNSDGEHQLQREKAENLADKAPADQNFLKVTHVLVAVLHVPSALLAYPCVV